MQVPEVLSRLKDFHGHLGPWVTVGLRIGDIARRELGDHRGMKCVVHCSTKPPMRCIVDGIQFSSGCTLGKGNISVEPGEEPMAVFTKEDRKLTVKLKQGLARKIDLEMSKAMEVQQSLHYYSMSEDDLVEVSKV